MKVTYTTKNQRLAVQIEESSAKETFRKLAEFQEVFDEPFCRLCSSENLQFVVRTVEGNDYYELRCRDCSGKLAFGQHKSGGSLFPKRKTADGRSGWYRWNE